MGGERPDAGKAVGDNDDPRPVGVEVVQCFGAHRKNNLLHLLLGQLAEWTKKAGKLSETVVHSDANSRYQGPEKFSGRDQIG